ncbi:unnamed protein product [Closterium sp. Yama58-4]|nr:unnamed protein product [Closterium sp. Yama58-4]
MEHAITDKEVTTMGGRLRQAFAWWASWCESSLILSVISNGYWLPWKALPPPSFRDKNHAGVERHNEFTRSAISDLLSSGAAAIAVGPNAVVCTSPLNVVEQRDKCRLILDLRKVNQHLFIPKFKYEGLVRVAELAQPGDWMFSIDLKSGYHHIDIHPSCWKFLGFHFDGTDYYFKSLPFGLATAPFLFTQLIKQLARRWRAQGTRVIPYVDDILFLCSSEKDACTIREAIIRDLRRSGLVINAKNSHLIPIQKLRFLGMELDTQSGRFTIGPERREQLMHTLRVLLTAFERRQRIPIRQVARVTGILASMALGLGTTARAFSHQLLELINAAPSWNARIHLTPEARDELDFWLQNFDRFNGAPFHMPHSIDSVIHVDASAHSWGATLASFPSKNLQGSSPMPYELLTTSSTRRELEGVLWALRTFSNQIKGRHVLMRADNQGVFFILRKGGSGKPELTLLCKFIIAHCMANEIRLAIEWIPRALNMEADALSKLEDNDDYSLKLPWFSLLERRWGPHTVDLFANANNAQLSRFFSKVPHPHSTAVNAFSQDWGAEHGFAFPPPHLIPATLRHAKRTSASLTLVIPEWTGASWWPLLRPSPKAWASGITSCLHLASGSQCLHVGSHTGAFSGAGLPVSRILALQLKFNH